MPEIIPPELDSALRTAGVNTKDPNFTRALEISLIAMSGSLPLPPASILAEYEKSFPGLVQKIVDWTDTQRQHRQALEKTRQERSERRMDRGQFIAGACALWGLTIAGAASIFGNPWAAAIIAIVAIGGPTAAVIMARTAGVQPRAGQKPRQSPSSSQASTADKDK